MSKEKFYRNPERGNDKPPQPYKPQWKIYGKEPTIMNGESTPPFTAQVVSPPKNIGNNVPFAETTVPTFKHDKLPNVGNNVENTWAGIDSISIEEEDEVQIQNQLMIDNNDFVKIPTNNSPLLDRLNKVYQAPQKKQDASFDNVLASLQANDYILLIKGKIFAIGSLESIQNEITSLIFEEKLAAMNASMDDLVVLKNVQIKVGVFLE
jgi:hypothetical protein